MDWARTKHGMTETLRSLMAAGRLEAGPMRANPVRVVERFLRAGAVAGDLRPDVRADDVAALLAGVMAVAAPEHRAQAIRLCDLVTDGLRST
ncbi:hypothetical protein ACIB24_16085 [Spongisporangium articulatum]|uniref:Transcriptional regulator SbtR-like C-terminal domain-containing protein n=1 Tax=Spongisporangium articulatum TaxID=3362603 RepID=A0ABW8AQE9_9ACTN